MASIEIFVLSVVSIEIFVLSVASIKIFVLSVASIESCVVCGEYRNLVCGEYRNVTLSMVSIEILCCVVRIVILWFVY